MDAQEIRERLADRIPRKVADATGLHYITVLRFMKPGSPEPRETTLKLLREYLSL